MKQHLNEPSVSLLKTAYERLGLQPYEVEIIISLAVTIAKLDQSTEIRTEHVAEAIQYRSVRPEDIIHNSKK